MINCVECGSEFEPTRKWNKFCSESCRARLGSRKWLRNNPVQRMLNAAKSRARASGIEFDLEPSDIQIPELCPVLGIRLVSKTGKSGGDYASPSLDRIDSSKGYVKGNVIVISWRANSLKKDGTAEELTKVAEWLRTQFSRSNCMTSATSSTSPGTT